MGRTIANNNGLSRLNYNQLFDYAVDNNILILDANITYDFYGVKLYVSKSDWTVTVK